jgi:hypothetical protein
MKPDESRTIFLVAVAMLVGVACSYCSTWQQDADTAVDTLQTACEAGLVEQAAVAAEAGRLGIPAEQVAAYLCSIPAIYKTFSPPLPRSADPPASRAIGTARELGVLR